MDAFCLFGYPPKQKRGALVDDNGYWVEIARNATSTRKPSSGLVRSVYHYWNLNVHNIQTDVQEQLVTSTVSYTLLVIKMKYYVGLFKYS